MSFNSTFPDGAEDYFKVDKAKEFLEKLNKEGVPEGYRLWQCLLCGYPQGLFKIIVEDIGVYCCGGCGQSCVRPINFETGKAE